MTPDACRGWREQLGVYTLGELKGDEAAGLRAHLEGCADCRAEADRLAPMRRLLSAADPERVAAAPVAPPELAERVFRRVAAERRAERGQRRRRMAIGFSAATASAAAAIAAVLILSQPSGGNGTSPAGSVPVAFRSLPSGVRIAADLAPRPWGSEVRVSVEGIRPGTVCMVWLRRRDGTQTPAGSFRYRYDRPNHAVLTSAVAPSQAVALGVQAGSRTFVADLPGRAS